MHVIAAQPDLYEVFVIQGTVQLLLQLLAHENTDIVSAVCNLLQVKNFFLKFYFFKELTDVEILHESEEGAEALMEELLKYQVIETLVQQAIIRLNESIQDEADAVHNALTVVENVIFLNLSLNIKNFRFLIFDLNQVNYALNKAFFNGF